jgi:phosphatidylglycerophosphate synthase
MPAEVEAPASAIAAVLVVVGAGRSGERVDPGSMIGGLPLIRRIVLSARSAGYGRVLIRDDRPEIRRFLDGTRFATLTAGDEAEPRSRGRVVILPANVVPQARWLRSLHETPLAAETVYGTASTAMVVETDDPGAVIAAAARGGDAESVSAELDRLFGSEKRPLDTDGCFPVVAPGDLARAETWLLRSLIKQREGFMSRHFERRISLAVTRRLAPTSITPNAMTLVSGGIGLSSAVFFLSSSAGYQLTGALLFLLHSILDGCDGELARLKFAESRSGAKLDFWGDNVVHVAIFAAIAVGWSVSAGSAWPLVPGALAAAATLATATVMFDRTVEDRIIEGSFSSRIVGALASRDFIYLVILAAAFGQARWILVAAAVGTPVFLAVVLWLDRRHGRIR